MTFIFYDTETTGLTAGFDQIFQFAAIITDNDLNTLEEVNLRCRLQSHVVPSPGALLITGMRPSDIEGTNLSHYQMIREVRALIERHTPAVIVGFNSIGYDEGMLRQAFYQTLNPVYLTNTDGNTRMDMLRVAHATSEYAPGVLQVPVNDDGRPTFKLGLLAPVNGLTHDDAHEAMSDTLVTLGLARLVRDDAPEVWEALYGSRSKRHALEFMDRSNVFCCTDMMFGQPTIVATKIAANPDNTSEVAVFDLSFDPTEYLDAGQDDIAAFLRASPRAIRIVKANQQPILMPLELGGERVSGIGLSSGDMMERSEQVKAHPTFATSVAHAVANRYPPWERSEHVEKRIYEGFPSRADENLMEEFHTRPWEERSDINSRFEDDRLRELGDRLIYIERPDVLSEEARRRLDAWHRERLLADEGVPWVTIGSALDELEELKTLDDGENAELLGDIEVYLRRLDGASRR